MRKVSTLSLTTLLHKAIELVLRLRRRVISQETEVLPTFIREKLSILKSKIDFHILATRFKNEGEFGEIPKIFLLGSFASHQHSIGDHSQTLGIERWLQDNFPNRKIVKLDRSTLTKHNIKSEFKNLVEGEDLIFISSSGDFGSTYVSWHATRREIIKAFPNNKIVQLPVTVFYHNDDYGQAVLEEDKKIYDNNKNIILMARDFESYKTLKEHFSCKILLVPDFALYLNIKLKEVKRNKALLVLRDDVESLFSEKQKAEIKSKIEGTNIGVDVFDNVTSYDIPEKDRRKCVEETLQHYQSHKLVVTDRFHGVIFSASTKTPCVALPELLAHKIYGSIDFFPSNIEFVDKIEHIPEAIAKVLATPFEAKDVLPYYSSLKAKILPPQPSECKIKPNGLMELIKGRRSIRKWLDRPVEEEKIKKILTAGIYAPTACNYQATRFYVVRDKMLIAEICKNTSPWFRNIYPDKLIAVLFDVEKPHPLGFNFKKRHPWSRFIWQDTAAAMMNMMLMAEALGLKTCWQSVEPKQLSNKEENIRRLLKISPRYILTCFLFLGYSNRKIDINTGKHYGVPIRRNEKESVLESLR